MRIFTPMRFEIFLDVGLCVSSIMLGVTIGMAIEHQPPNRAEVTTITTPALGTNSTTTGDVGSTGAPVPGSIFTTIPLFPRAILNAAADRNGDPAMIHVDERGRVIAKCDLEP